MQALSYTLLLLLIQFIKPDQAEAYVDFGTGSMIMQSIMAALVGGGFFFKDSIARIFGKFKAKKDSGNEKN